LSATPDLGKAAISGDNDHSVLDGPLIGRDTEPEVLFQPVEAAPQFLVPSLASFDEALVRTVDHDALLGSADLYEVPGEAR
jgi:hypothetical protein